MPQTEPSRGADVDQAVQKLDRLHIHEDPGGNKSVLRRSMPTNGFKKAADSVEKLNGDEGPQKRWQRRESVPFNGKREHTNHSSGTSGTYNNTYNGGRHEFNRRESRNFIRPYVEPESRPETVSNRNLSSQQPPSVEIQPLPAQPSVINVQPAVQQQPVAPVSVRIINQAPQQQIPIPDTMHIPPMGYNQDPIMHQHPNYYYPMPPASAGEAQFYQQPFVDYSQINGYYDATGQFYPQPILISGANGMPIQPESFPGLNASIAPNNIHIPPNFIPPALQYTVPPPVLSQYQEGRPIYPTGIAHDYGPVQELNQNQQHHAPGQSQRASIGGHRPIAEPNGGPRSQEQGSKTQEDSGRQEQGRTYGRRREDNARRPQMVDGQLIKSALCRNILMHGRCDYGDRCHFAHHIEELTLKPASDNFKTVECMEFVNNNGQCPYGYKCHYFHDGEDPFMRRVNDTRSVADFVAAKEELQRKKRESEPSQDDPGPSRS